MSDTQWPRFQVFHQDRPGRPHRSVGTVHAPDEEMALLNARDVFARRPAWFSAWIIPQELIFSRTVEQLAQDDSWRHAPIPSEAPRQVFYIFQKQTQRRSMTFTTHVGEVEARTSEEALGLALERFPGDDVWVWWVVPAAAIRRSDPDDVSSWFEPVEDKVYRQQAYYGTITARPQRGKRRLKREE